MYKKHLKTLCLHHFLYPILLDMQYQNPFLSFSFILSNSLHHQEIQHCIILLETDDRCDVYVW